MAAAAAASVGVVAPLYRQTSRITGISSAGKLSRVMRGSSRSGIGGSTGKFLRLATIAISSICAMPIIRPGMMPASSR